MDIQNIVALTAQLKAIGFDNMGHALLKRICFLPESFIITEKLHREADKIIFSLHFEKGKDHSGFKMVYYDAVLQKEITFPSVIINGINIKEVDQKMAVVDWRTAFDFTTKKLFNPDDKLTYETELQIQQIISWLNKLGTNNEGKNIAEALKQKYWSDLPYVDVMGNITNSRNKSEISQRFYYSEGQPIITTDEAYRYLQNKWMEKQIQAKRKRSESHKEDSVIDTQPANNNGLSKKHKSNKAKNIKKSNTTQY